MKISGRTPPLQPPNPDESRMVSKEIGFRLKVKTPNHGLSVLRFLLTKHYARREPLNEKEGILIYELVCYFDDLKNFHFFEQNRDQWLAVRQLTRLYLEEKESQASWVIAQISILGRKVYYSPRAFISLKKEIVTDRILVRFNRRHRPTPPPPRQIGVGYRDKGTAQIPHYDASPKWQQVAMRSETWSSDTFGYPGLSIWETMRIHRRKPEQEIAKKSDQFL